MLSTVSNAAQTTTFRSILWPSDAPPGRVTTDAVLHDLALDQVLQRTAAAAPAAADAFRTLCSDGEQVRYRQELFRALEGERLRKLVDDFLLAVDAVDRCDTASQKAHYAYERELWHLRAVVRYARAITAFADGLAPEAESAEAEGIRLLARYLADFRASDAFIALTAEASATDDGIAALRYNVLTRGGRITVAAVDDEPDLREDVLETFARFRDADEEPRGPSAVSDFGLEHVQAWILERVAKVHPAPFARLVAFFSETARYRDQTLMTFAAEVRFYLAYLDHLAPLRGAGLPVCYPVVSTEHKELDVHDTFDLALATGLVPDGAVVLNDLRLSGPERILVISGPNQGGKTTTARTFGQLHHLAAIGCPVPGRAARIFLCDQVLTEFEREEQLDDLEGRLGAEVERMHAFLGEATGRTVLVLNEVFSSTALQDARTLTRDVLERILALDAIAVCVTFIDELSRIDDRTVSMVSTVDPDDAARRTFRVERRAADGRAYARALAAKHGLTVEQIRERMAGKEQGR